MAYGYNTPNVDASLRYLLVKSSCEVESVEDNVQKTSFPTRPVAESESAVSDARNPICLDPPTPCGLAKSMTKVQYYSDKDMLCMYENKIEDKKLL